MSKHYRVGLMFHFDPTGEHEELFDGMDTDTEERLIALMKSMVSEDIDRLVKYNEVWDALQVELIDED